MYGYIKALVINEKEMEYNCTNERNELKLKLLSIQCIK